MRFVGYRLHLGLFFVCAFLSVLGQASARDLSVVTTSADYLPGEETPFPGGKVSLRDAIRAVHTNDTVGVSGQCPAISFDIGEESGNAPAVIVLKGPLYVSNTIHCVIDGANGGRGVSLLGVGAKGPMVLNRGVLDVRNLTFRDGVNTNGAYATGQGGAIASLEGMLAVSNCAFYANRARNGSAVYVAPQTALRMMACSFSSNQCVDVGQEKVTYGGAVLALGSGAIATTTFYDNWIESSESSAGMDAQAVSALALGEDILTTKSTFFMNYGGKGACGVFAQEGKSAYDPVLLDCLFAYNIRGDDVLGDIYNASRKLRLLYVDATTNVLNASACSVLQALGFDPQGGGKMATSQALSWNAGSVCHNGVLVNRQVATNQAQLVFYDEMWTNVCYRMAGHPVAEVKALRGSSELADCTLACDQLGGSFQATEQTARGAIWSKWGADIVFRQSGNNATTLTGVVGEPLPGGCPEAPANVLSFVGWCDTNNVFYYDASANPIADKVVPGETLFLEARYEATLDTFQVTSEDECSPDTGKMSLRSVLAYATVYSNDFNRLGRTVTFKDVSNVTLTNKLVIPYDPNPLVLAGPTSGVSVTLSPAYGVSCSLIHSSRSLEVRDLTFVSGVSSDKGGAVCCVGEIAPVSLVAYNCAFGENCAATEGGAVYLANCTDSRFENCTFYKNTASVKGAAASVQPQDKAAVRFLSCSFVNNGESGVSVINGQSGASGSVGYVDTLFCSFDNASAVDFAGDAAMTFEDHYSLVSTNATDVFAGPDTVYTSTVGTVLHAYPLARNDACWQQDEAVWVWHDQEWKQIAISPDAPGASKQPIFRSDDVAKATLCRTRDLLNGERLRFAWGAVDSQLGVKLVFDSSPEPFPTNDSSNRYACCGTRDCFAPVIKPSETTQFMGWWTLPNMEGTHYFDAQGNALVDMPFVEKGQLTLYAGYSVDPKLLVVNYPIAGSGSGSGLVTLSDAIETLRKYPNARSADGTRTISFHCGAQTSIVYAQPLSIPSDMPPFAIDGYNDGYGVTLCSTNANALFYSQSPNLVCLRNLTLRGGELCLTAQGMTMVSNCCIACVSNATQGVFTITTNGARVVCLDSSFVDNSAVLPDASGMYVELAAVPAGSYAGFVNCTFHANGSSATLAPGVHRLLFVGSGDLNVLNGTFVENAYSDLAQETLRAHFAGCVILGNRNTACPDIPINNESNCFANCSFGTPVACASPFLTNCVSNVTVQAAFTDGTADGIAVTQCVNSVVQTFYEPYAEKAALLDKPIYVYHDAFWTNLAYAYEDVLASGVIQTNWTLLCGVQALATMRLQTDSLGESVAVEGRGAIRSRWHLALQFEDVSPGETRVCRPYCGDAPPVPAPIAQKNVCQFQGWFSPVADQLIYDASGELVEPSYRLPYEHPFVLKPRWGDTVDMLRVTTSADLDAITDAGEVSLRVALQVLERHSEWTNRTVSFAEGLGEVVLTNQLVWSSLKPLVVNGGDGEDCVTVSGDSKVALFRNTAQASLTMRNVTWCKGLASSEGVISSSGDLLLENCAVVSNYAEGPIIRMDCARLTLLNSYVGENTCVDGALVSVSNASCVVANSTFYANEISGNAHGLLENWANSLAIRSAILNSDFVGNTFANASESAVVKALAGTLSLVGCAFADNQTDSAAGVCTLASCLGARVDIVRVTSTTDACTLTGGTLAKTDFSVVSDSARVFVNVANPNTAYRAGVKHVYFVPETSFSEAAMDQGVWIYHDAVWTNVAYATVISGVGRVSVLGDAARAIYLTAVDEISSPIGATAYRGAIIPLSVNELVVTTPCDIVNAADSWVSLREAITAVNCGAVNPDDAGNYTITFDDALFSETNEVCIAFTNQLSISTKSNRVVIQGPTDGRRVVLSVFPGTLLGVSSYSSIKTAADTDLALRDLVVAMHPNEVSWNETTKSPAYGHFLDVSGNVSLERCTFLSSESAKEGGFALSTAGTASYNRGVIRDCSFVGSQAGGLNLGGHGSYVVCNCTFSGVIAYGTDSGVITFSSSLAPAGLTNVVVNSTFVDCKGTEAAFWVSQAQGVTPVAVANSVFFNNGAKSSQCDIKALGTNAVFKYVTYSRVSTYHAELWTNCVEVVDSNPDNLFAGGLRSMTIGSVPRYFRPLKIGGYGDRYGCYVFYDDAWTNVWVSESTTSFRVAHGLTGKKSLAMHANFLAYDISSRPLATGSGIKASPGSYATLTDVEDSSECGKLVVTSVVDDKSSVFDEYDGVVSLREAIQFAQTHDAWRDAQNRCTISFGSGSFFTDSASVRTIRYLQRQIEIVSMTNGATLVLQGPSEAGRSLTLDGDGKYRLFYVAPGNRFVLENVNLTNALASTAGKPSANAGGACFNAGYAVLSNCSFSVCRAGPVSGATDGGALCTAGGATSLVERCTFTGCSAAYGGALHIREGGTLTAVASVFTDCSATNASSVVKPGGGAVYASYPARAAFVNCTFTRNETSGLGGALHAVCDTNAPSVFLLDSLVVGNGADLGGDDMFLLGNAKCYRVGYAQRMPSGSAEGTLWADEGVCSSATPATLFAYVTDAGVPMPVAADVQGVHHLQFPLRTEIALQGTFVRYLEDWSSVGSFPSATSYTRARRLYGSSSLTALFHGDLLTLDALGVPYAEATPGASALRIDPTDPPVPTPDPVDPLCVTNDDWQTFLDVLAYAQQNARYVASNGCVTITFKENFTLYPLTTTVLTEFSAYALCLKGPVTFDGRKISSADGSRRIFEVADGNTLRLVDVSLVNGWHVECGGAIFMGSLTHLEATNVLFSACCAGSSESEFAYGGALAYWGDGSASAVLRACRFVDCMAVGLETDARLIYHEDDALACYDCTFSASSKTVSAGDVASPFGARVDKKDGTKNYFFYITDALRDCVEGDVLVRLSEDVDTSAIVLPYGVSFKDESDAAPSEVNAVLWNLAQRTTASLAQDDSLNHFSAVVGGNGSVVFSLNEKAAPLLTGDGAEVSLAGDPTCVTVMPANVKPGLFYGLGRADAPEGPYTVEANGWVRADDKGALPTALTAPKSGAQGYYRVIVRQ